MRLTLETRAWYLDKFGMERECVAITVGSVVLAVMSLEGERLDVRAEDLYYVPQHAEEGGA